MSLVLDTVESIDELIRLKRESIRLLEELRGQLAFCARAGLDPKNVERTGYDSSKDERWTRWTATEQRTIGVAPEPNYAILKDGTRVDVPIDWKAKRDEYRANRRKGQ